MKIVTLLENTAVSEKFLNKHGLSFYVETEKHKIIVDMGPDISFIENAEKLGVDISEVDTVFLSHGHNDHGGGLPYLIENNKKAKIYIRESAFNGHFAKNPDESLSDAGVDKSLKKNSRIIFTDDYMEIDDELSIFSNIKGRKHFSTANLVLMEETAKGLIPDEFGHEQCLVIRQNGNFILMGGCAHNGIVNILDRFNEIYGCDPNYVISGFHLYNPSYETAEKAELIEAVAKDLCKHDCKYFTCHCTGLEPYGILKNIMGERIGYLSAGSITKLEF